MIDAFVTIGTTIITFFTIKVLEKAWAMMKKPVKRRIDKFLS